MKQHLKYYLQSISILLLLVLVPVSAAFASDEEGTISIGDLNGHPEQDPISVDSMQYIKISLGVSDKDTFIHYAPIAGIVTVTDPDGDEKTYGFAVDDWEEGTTYVGFLIGHNAPLGTWSYHIKTNDDITQEYDGSFEVIN